uniref:Uncharacterized protein n=1 Tax=Leersia perrieri TaxID=77586 RepID=A0A0D9WP83_9ORYZ
MKHSVHSQNCYTTPSRAPEGHTQLGTWRLLIGALLFALRKPMWGKRGPAHLLFTLERCHPVANGRCNNRGGAPNEIYGAAVFDQHKR